MVATQISHKLVFSARPFMKNVSWGYCVLVFDSSGQPATHQRNGDSCAPGGFGTEIDVGRTSSCEENADTAMNAPMDHESSMG